MSVAHNLDRRTRPTAHSSGQEDGQAAASCPPLILACEVAQPSHSHTLGLRPGIVVSADISLSIRAAQPQLHLPRVPAQSCIPIAAGAGRPRRHRQTCNAKSVLNEICSFFSQTEWHLLTVAERHYSYECKAAPQERPYIARPSRTQQLSNPKLLPKLSNEVPDVLLKK